MMKLRNHADGSALFASEKIEPILPSLDLMGKKTSEDWACTPEVEVYSANLSALDLSGYDMQDVNFDAKTVWPSDSNRCPKGAEYLEKINEFGKNPGLGIRSLHEKGKDGTGISLAIIDQPLCEHSDYCRENPEKEGGLVHYEEIGYDNSQENGSMHGAAVASILVGKNCGVVPKAKLYYFAANALKEKNGHKIRTADYRVQALEKILKINEDLEKQGRFDEKIQVVSVSAGWMGGSKTDNFDKWWEVLEKAKQKGVFVLSTNVRKEYGLAFNGLGKNAYGDSNQIDSYLECPYNLPQSYLSNNSIFVPMDHRTVASPTGKDEYVHYVHGGMSWATPWLAGMFALARQQNSEITPEEFWKIAITTGVFSEKVKGTVIQPEKLISGLQKEKNYSLKKIMQNGQKRAIQRKEVQKLQTIMKGKENAK